MYRVVSVIRSTCSCSSEMSSFKHFFLLQLNGNPANAKEEKIQMLTERINDLVQQVRLFWTHTRTVVKHFCTTHNR